MASTERQQAEGARNQSLFREVNERIDGLGVPQDFEVLCECASRACADPIPLAPDEYEAVRAEPTHFLVKPGHVDPEIERVVGETDRYFVVEKIGEAGNVAARLNPRGRSGDLEDAR